MCNRDRTESLSFVETFTLAVIRIDRQGHIVCGIVYLYILVDMIGLMGVSLDNPR